MKNTLKLFGVITKEIVKGLSILLCTGMGICIAVDYAKRWIDYSKDAE